MYYRNNVSNTQVLFDVVVEHGIETLSFLRQQAFGEPEYTPCAQTHFILDKALARRLHLNGYNAFVNTP